MPQREVPAWMVKVGIIAGVVCAVAAVLGLVLTHLPGAHGQGNPDSTRTGAVGLTPTPSSSPTRSASPKPSTAPTGPPVITSSQAVASLLTGPQIASIAGSFVVSSLSALNEVPMLDLSLPSGDVSSLCADSSASLPVPPANSPVESGLFNGGSLSDGPEIGEQVAAYGKGGGAAALAAASAALSGCAFSPTPGLPPNMIEFTADANPTEGEWDIENDHDVLIEVGISQSGQAGLLGKLVSAIAANVSKARLASR
jgi:hypothetical protein